jgi:hypothetical protein
LNGRIYGVIKEKDKYLCYFLNDYYNAHKRIGDISFFHFNLIITIYLPFDLLVVVKLDNF